MLDLPTKTEATANAPPRTAAKACEICGVQHSVLEGAHWIAAKDGGSARMDNILRLCPNCHKRLDVMEDSMTTKRAREILLLRAASAFLQSNSGRDEQTQREFLTRCSRIIERKQ
jgi:fructose-1,6-bisphosphatase